MGELHALVELRAATDFQPSALFCRYSLHAGPNWSLVGGPTEGQTTTDSPLYEGPVVWAHPIDLHYVTKGIQGWPKLLVQVYCLDSIGRSWLVGYTCCAIPSSPGAHTLTCPCWVPSPTSIRDKIRQYFLGGSHQLLQPDALALGRDRYIIPGLKQYIT